jgi:hypothetical protein
MYRCQFGVVAHPLHRSIGYGGRILREGNSWKGEPALTCIVVLHATPYRRLGKCRRMQWSSIAWNQGPYGCTGLNGGFGRLWNVSSESWIDDRGWDCWRPLVGGYGGRVVFQRLWKLQGGDWLGGRIVVHEEVCKVLKGEWSEQLSTGQESTQGTRRNSIVW